MKWESALIFDFRLNYLFMRIFILMVFLGTGAHALSAEQDISADERYMMLTEAFSQEKFDDALGILYDMKEDYQKSRKLWRAFGHVYYKLEQYKNCAESYRKALEYGDNLDFFEDNYVVALMRSGQEDVVVEMAERLVEVEEKSPFLVRIICYACTQNNDQTLFNELLRTLSKDDLNDGENPFVIAATAKHFAKRKAEQEK